MGVWGTSLYSNDTAEDLRDLCNEIYPFYSTEKAMEVIKKEFDTYFMEDCLKDGDYADFWFAFADWHWKHGLLSEEHRLKVLELLKSKTGILEWEESGCKKDIAKRLEVMKALEEKLLKEMPPVKLPRACLDKPRHKPGDIIIIKTCTEEEDPSRQVGYSKWLIDKWALDDFYKDENLRMKVVSLKHVEIPGNERINIVSTRIMNTPVPITLINNRYEFSPPISLYNRYIAILCVGEIQKKHSPYVNDVFDRTSAYAIYDNVWDEMPTVDDFKKCGFIPSKVGNKYYYISSTPSSYYRKKDFNRYGYAEVYKQHCSEEVERFFKLLRFKKYDETPTPYWLVPCLRPYFAYRFLCDKVGLEIDNLLDENGRNQELVSDEEIDIRLRDFNKLVREEFYKELAKRNNENNGTTQQ